MIEGDRSGEFAQSDTAPTSGAPSSQNGGGGESSFTSKAVGAAVQRARKTNPMLDRAASEIDELNPLEEYVSTGEIIEIAGRAYLGDEQGAAELLMARVGPDVIRKIADENDSKLLDKLADSAEKYADEYEASGQGDDPMAPGFIADTIDTALDDGKEGDPDDADAQGGQGSAVTLGGLASGSGADRGNPDEDMVDDFALQGGAGDEEPVTPAPVGPDGTVTDEPVFDDDESEDDSDDEDDDEDDDGGMFSGGGTRAVVIVALAAPAAAVALIIFMLMPMITGAMGGAGGGGAANSDAENQESSLAAGAFCRVDDDAQFSGSEPRAAAQGQSEQSLLGGKEGETSIEGLDPAQTKNASTIYETLSEKKAPESVIKSALIAAHAETELKNLSNDGSTANPSKYEEAIAKSADADSDGDGAQGNSVGVLGLTYPQWGEVDKLMDVKSATLAYLDGALKETGYKEMKPADLAKKVTDTTSPDKYDNSISMADTIFSTLSDKATSGGGGGPGLGAADKGQLLQPMGKGRYQQTSGFGERWGSMHDGADWAGEANEPEFAVADGKVVKSEPASGYGNWIIIGITLKNGDYIEALYGHMAAENMFVKAGDKVKAGQKVALQGSEGQSTGPHLHFGIYPGGWKQGGGVDPIPYLRKEALPIGKDGNLDTSSLGGDNAEGGDDKGTEAVSTAGKYGEAGDPWGYLDNGKITEKIDTLNPVQMRNAREIVRQTEAMGMPKKAAMIALATAMQESTYLIYANKSVPISLKEPHDAVGEDHDSVGLFQQRFPMWSPDVRRLMTPWSSTELFLEHLKDVGGWESMPVTVAAQTVQGSAYPDAYAKWEGLATTVANKFYDGSGKGANPSAAEDKEGGQGYTAQDASTGFTSPDTEVLTYQSDTFCVNEDGSLFKVDDKFGTGEQGAYTPGSFRTAMNNDDKKPTIQNASDTKDSGEVKTTGKLGEDIVQYALSVRGTPYAWGGGTYEGPSKGISDGGGAADAHGDFNKVGFDCSGLVLWAAYQASGGKIKLEHYTGEQQKGGKEVPMDKLEPGDAIYIGESAENSHHVVIYMGNKKVVEAPQSGDVVKVSPLSNFTGEGNFARRFGA